MKRAVVVSYNWETNETMSTPFTGPGCADTAAGWCHEDSFLWEDFPADCGWEHFFRASPSAMAERGDRITKELIGNGTTSERIPKR